MLENLQPPNKKTPCKVRTVMDSLNELDAQILEAAVLDSAKWKIKTLADELKSLGLVISEKPLTTHRARLCSCWKI
jgi:metal-responsive CopG/Arc/MetJ family transcriptional regulator